MTRLKKSAPSSKANAKPQPKPAAKKAAPPVKKVAAKPAKKVAAKPAARSKKEEPKVEAAPKRVSGGRVTKAKERVAAAKPAAKKAAPAKKAAKKAAPPAKKTAAKKAAAKPAAKKAAKKVAPPAKKAAPPAKKVAAKPAAKSAAKKAAPAKPPAKKNPLIAAKEEELQGLTLDKLKALLKQNDQVTTGVKGDLIKRIADGMIYGALPRCPLCHGGRLKWDATKGLYYCPGFMDDDVFKACKFQAIQVARNPWKEAE